MVKRVRQFVRAVTAKLTTKDIEFINRFLNEEEKNLFMKLSTYEQKHSIYVAKYISENINDSECKDEKYMIKAGLLHDVGKTKVKLNIVDRVALVLLSKIMKDKLRNYKSRKVYIYYNHGEEGYNILKEMNYSDEFLSLIRYHHEYSNTLNNDLKLLMDADNFN